MQNSFLTFFKYSSRFLLVAYFLIAASCTYLPPSTTPVTIRVQYSYATQPWLQTLYNCAGKNVVAAEMRAAKFQDPQSVELVMRTGQPDYLNIPAYQIGTDDLLVIVNPQNPVDHLTADQVRGLFTGQIQTWDTINASASPVQIWVFPPAEDVQRIFDQTVLAGIPVASQARLANNPDEMLQAVSSEVNAIGILTRRWKITNIKSVFTAASNLPVLALTRTEPQEALAQILSCLQK
jgi:hypothetical protein